MTTKLIYLISIFILSFYAVFAGNNSQQKLNKTTLTGDIYHVNVNNFDLGIENNGNTGLDANSFYPSGTTLSPLYSGGFATSGYVNGQLRVSWMASSTRTYEFQSGKWGMDPNDPRAKFYVVEKKDKQGSEAYINWATAVELGADFVDLDDNGVYDPNVDMPDLIGDITVWCVYNDGRLMADRALATQPLGLEVHQSAWAFNRADALGDVVFLRYRLINAGGTDIDDLILSGFLDPDLGDMGDDLIGCDIDLSLGYIYNHQDDSNYGVAVPSFGVDFFQGPVVDSPGDTAYIVRGPFLGVDTLVDKKNLPLTSFSYFIQGSNVLGDPNNAAQARYYQMGGLDMNGDPVIPTDWGQGGDATSDIRYIYHGDPVAVTGWRDTSPADKRFMVNSGPFQIAVGDTQDIVVAYIVGHSSNALKSVTKLKENDVIAQNAYNGNFDIAGPPPAPEVFVRAFNEEIDLIFNCYEMVTYQKSDALFKNQVFEGFKIVQYASANTSDEVNGMENAQIIARFDINNQYKDLYLNTEGQGRIRAWEGQNNLDYSVYADSVNSNFRYRITTDAFDNNNPLVNNKTYYFAVIPFSINVNGATLNENTEKDPDDWSLPTAADMLEPSASSVVFSATPGSNENFPFKADIHANHVEGNSDGFVLVDVVERDSVTGHDYEVTFFGGNQYWRLTDVTTNQVKLDSMTFQGNEGTEFVYPIVDGISVKVYGPPDELANWDYEGTRWLTAQDNSAYGLSQFYGGSGLVKYFWGDVGTTPDEYFPLLLEVEMEDVSKAYSYANWDMDNYLGLIDVPFKAWDMTDESNPRQVNIVIRDRNTDGEWNPTSESTEYLYIMTSSYDENDYYPASHSFADDAYIVFVFLPRGGYTWRQAPFSMTITPNYINLDSDVFEFSTASLRGELTNTERKQLLENVLPVPNPYFGYSTYETSYNNQIIKFTNLDRNVTIRIFNLAGQLVRTLRKNDTNAEMSWDVRNETGLKVASGIYIAHIEVPGVGEKVLKLAIIQREERIVRY